MKLNQRIQIKEGESSAVILGTCWASVELSSISLHNATVGSVNKFSYLIHIRINSPFAVVEDIAYRQILWNGKLFNVDTVSETKDGRYLRLLCTETSR